MIREIKFRFAITSPHWDDEPGNTKLSEPLTLGQIIDHDQIDFTDGGYIDWDDLKWETDTVHYLQFTGLKDKNGLTEVYERDIIDVHGTIIGNYYETPTLLEDPTNHLVAELGTKDWANTEKEALARGCRYAQ